VPRATKEPVTPAGVRLSPAQVIETAAEIADAEGIDAVTLTRVAHELGVRQPALYRHVDGIEALRRALALQARDMLADELTRAAIGRSREDAIRAVASAWRRFVHDHPGLYSVTDRVPSQGDAELEHSVDRVVGVLALALGGYPLSPETTVHAARSIRSALHGFVVLEKDNGHPEPYGLDSSYEHLVTLVCAGVLRMAEERQSPSSQPKAAGESARRRT
jgi:AcrR family transcriptional regulator